jgi:hypothetical protein
MMERSGRRTVPQIYIDDRHVGGFEDLAALDAAGGLIRCCATTPDNPRPEFFPTFTQRPVTMSQQPDQPVFSIEKLFVKDLVGGGPECTEDLSRTRHAAGGNTNDDRCQPD